MEPSSPEAEGDKVAPSSESTEKQENKQTEESQTQATVETNSPVSATTAQQSEVIGNKQTSAEGNVFTKLIFGVTSFRLSSVSN